VAPSHLTLSAREAGSAAAGAETRKVTKYRSIVASGDFIFTPVAIETFGTWGQAANSFCQELGGLIARESGILALRPFLGNVLAWLCSGEMWLLSWGQEVRRRTNFYLIAVQLLINIDFVDIC
jgi:hypothetical protein